MGIAVAVAPPEEQDGIVRAMGEETAPLRATIERARREIHLLREYRTRLIADIVTGKLDVREAAARLPEEIDDGDELENIESGSVDEEAATDSPEEALEDTEA